MKMSFLSRMMVVLGTVFLLFGGVAGVYAADGDLPLTIRVRGLGIFPDDDSDIVGGGKAAVDNSVGVEIDFTYFFQKHIAAELVLGVAQHNVELRDSDLDDLSGNPLLNDVDLGDVWLVPPTLLLQYHFMPEAKVRPYVGAGLNYSIFFEENAGTIVLDTGYDNAVGYAFQAGVDISITENFSFNIDLKKIYLETEADVTLPAGALGPGSAITKVKTDVDIDPILLGVGIAYHF